MRVRALGPHRRGDAQNNSRRSGHLVRYGFFSRASMNHAPKLALEPCLQLVLGCFRGHVWGHRPALRASIGQLQLRVPPRPRWGSSMSAGEPGGSPVGAGQPDRLERSRDGLVSWSLARSRKCAAPKLRGCTRRSSCFSQDVPFLGLPIRTRFGRLWRSSRRTTRDSAKGVSPLPGSGSMRWLRRSAARQWMGQSSTVLRLCAVVLSEALGGQRCRLLWSARCWCAEALP